MQQLTPITSRDQLQTASPSSTQSSMDRLQRLKAGKEFAEKILKRYPEYGKAPVEYLAAITELLAACDYRTQCRMADIMTGISARCQFLPTVADFAKFAAEINPPTSNFNRAEYRVLDEPRQPFRPYPKLWEAFADEPGLLKMRDSLTFDRLTQASLRLATEGREAARAVLEAP